MVPCVFKAGLGGHGVKQDVFPLLEDILNLAGGTFMDHSAHIAKNAEHIEDAVLVPVNGRQGYRFLDGLLLGRHAVPEPALRDR